MDLQKEDRSGDKSIHLVVIIDLSSDSLLLRKDLANKTPSYLNWISSIIAFCNSHLMLNYRNQLTVIISGLDSNQIVFPSKPNGKVKKSLEGQYELFSTVSSEVLSKIKEMINRTKEVVEKAVNSGQSRQFSTVLAGSIAVGLCRINRLESTVDESRICILTSSRESPAFYASQYMNFMNSFFSAQKMRVAIDCCVVDDTNEMLSNSILQQGCDLTGGFYLKINNVQSTLEYLLWVFLPSIETRKKMILPTKAKISYKASCFCHRNQVDIGYVCSVCLSSNQIVPVCCQIMMHNENLTNFSFEFPSRQVFQLGPEPNVKLKRRKVAN